MAKSFASALMGIAIDEGHIKSVDEPITNYLPELLEKDKRFRSITIRHLLTMTSGIKYEEGGDLPWSEDADDTKTYYATDLRELALNCQIEGEPGKYFEYNNYNPLLVGMILERATGMPVSHYMEAKLWMPMGMEADGS
jgi:CubicO group peptidase (beta-lactamase class C family)